jgi:ATP-dependent RNA helicase RhlE
MSITIRTIKKSKDTGTLNRAQVREVVIRVRDAVVKRPSPSPGYPAVASTLEGTDVLARVPRGTGMTTVVMEAALSRLRYGKGLRMLVLCPTRDLAQNAGKHLRETELSVSVVVGGTPIDKDEDLRAGIDVLVATPGRLNDHIERGSVSLSEIAVLVLDEADQMLDMGYKPQIDHILRRVPNNRQTLFFTATLPDSVKSFAYEIMRDPITFEAAPRVTTAVGAEQYVYPVEDDKKTALLLEILKKGDVQSALVFVRTKFSADRLAARLTREGLKVDVMHNDRNMTQRVRALESFRNGIVSILIATDVAQGVFDEDGITHVINFDAPKDPEGYVHRVSRTACGGGEKGVAIIFMSGGETGDVAAVEHLLGYRLPRVHVPGTGVSSENEVDRVEREVGVQREHVDRQGIPQRTTPTLGQPTQARKAG